MKTQHRAFGILAVSAVLAAGLLGASKPAAASGLMHPLQIGQKAVIADHDGDWNYDGGYRRDDRRREEFRQQEIRQQEIRQEEFRQEEIRQAEFRRQQEIRREEERRHEEWLRDHRDFRHDGYRDRNDDSLQIVIR